ncbi:MAG: polysaccharide biosynthesis protein [Spirochaetaceae bacterium]|jgi:FlaA1/EpsC-like NDP-sugar epimerase|nr:polysaccharide biosynthesis protein [Spirochaetaceae bacterium]
MGTAQSKRLYIIGAGFAGRKLAQEIREKAVFGEAVAFLDDDPEKIGRQIDGIPVLGPIRDVARLLRTMAADEAVIAMPTASREYLKDLYGILKAAGFEKIRILPGIAQIVEGDAHLVQTRSIDLQDLLGRTPVAVQLKKSIAYLREKRVLVTGAGGSIGSELCRQLLSAGVQRLYLFGHGENSIYQIDRELRLLQNEGVGEKTVVIPVLGDLKDRDFLGYILGKLRADVIFHAAAYKHVPMTEENPVAGIQNNVFGTRNLVEAAMKNGIKRFVLITTDKAVEPVSVYGASKHLCERIVLEAAKTEPGANKNESPNTRSVPRPDSQTQFMGVRFGNVLGSRGSIVPLFQTQIEQGGPVTITHPDTRRWFMTIPEACSLVLKAGGVGKNGELYLLDMGESVKIKDIAEQMIRFYGYEPGTDIKIETIGLRPGERLDERLCGSDEEPAPTGEEGILVVHKKPTVRPPLSVILERLRPVCFLDRNAPAAYRNTTLLRKILKEAAPTLNVS